MPCGSSAGSRPYCPSFDGFRVTRFQSLDAPPVLLVLLAGAGAWCPHSAWVADAYTETAANSGSGRGDARLHALNQMHGKAVGP